MQVQGKVLIIPWFCSLHFRIWLISAICGIPSLATYNIRPSLNIQQHTASISHLYLTLIAKKFPHPSPDDVLISLFITERTIPSVVKMLIVLFFVLSEICWGGIFIAFEGVSNFNNAEMLKTGSLSFIYSRYQNLKMKIKIFELISNEWFRDLVGNKSRDNLSEIIISTYWFYSIYISWLIFLSVESSTVRFWLEFKS